AEAENAEHAAKAAFDAANAAEEEIAGRRAIVYDQFLKHTAALNLIKSRNPSLLPQIETARSAYEAALATTRQVSSSVFGLRPSDKALRAVAYALTQANLHKMYEWAAEGPNTFD